jgi:hypothetical protein
MSAGCPSVGCNFTGQGRKGELQVMPANWCQGSCVCR